MRRAAILVLLIVLFAAANVGAADRVEGFNSLFVPYIFFWAAAMLLMALSNWLMWRRRYKTAGVATLAAAYVAVAAAAVADFTVFIYIAIIAATIAAFDDENRSRMIVVVFYIAMVISIIMEYTAIIMEYA